MGITYLPPGAKVFRSKAPPPRTGYPADGYCRKGSTELYVVLPGSKRKHRVWVTCFSNCASRWITVNKKTIHLNDTEEIQNEI